MNKGIEMSKQFIENAKKRGAAFKREVVAATESAQAVDIAVSYLQMSGWFLLEGALKRVSERNIRIITTDQMNVTQPAVLRAAIRRGIHVRCYRGNRVFHPKVFVIHGTDKANDVAIVGSANISFSGLEGCLLYTSPSPRDS